MRGRDTAKSFPGTDSTASKAMTDDVVTDENLIVSKLRGLRDFEGVSLESLAFLLGAQPAQLSRQLSGKCSTSLLNYIRIVRALGYRCDVSFKQATGDPQTSVALKKQSTKLLRSRKSGRKINVDDQTAM